ncbi:transglutaminase domain-containing protein [Thermodesulfobacteriota bacterium]
MKKRFVYHCCGAVVVLVWVLMVGRLIRTVHFGDADATVDEMRSVATIDAPERTWKEIYLKNDKVGYSVSMINPQEDGYLIQEEVFLKLNLMGLSSGMHTVTWSNVDKQFFLKNFNFRMSSGAVDFKISGRVEGDYLVFSSGKGASSKSQRIRLTSRPMLGATMGHFFKHQRINVGESFRIPVFDPSTMSQKEVLIKVVAKEPIEISRFTYDAYRLEAVVWGRTMTFWVDQDGTTLKEEGFMGLVAVKSNAARAPRDIKGSMDFYEASAVAADRKLPDHKRLRYLKVELHGIEGITVNTDAWHGGRQKYRDGILEINKESVPVGAPLILPYNSLDNNLKPFLEPDFNIESQAPEIINKASEIAGREKSPLAVAGRTMTWVYQNLEKRPVVSIPSAKEVLRTRVGDCNEHATLLTALLRASGIPARLSIGLVYTRNQFFYHAWTEAYIGEWISMDAVLNQMPVDATHIKLIEGNLDKQVELAGLIGLLKLKVIDYAHD